MAHRKQNISLWCAIGLVLILAVGTLILTTGTAMARYRVDQKEENQIEIRPLEQIHLGQMKQPEEDPEGAPYFDPTGEGVWTLAEDKNTMTFTVANGTDEDAWAKHDQQAVVRLVGSLGIWNGSDELTIYLRVPATEPTPEIQPDGEAEEPKGYAAAAERIPPDSPLYSTFGDGWIFTFLDEEGEELSWLLEGGKLSCLEMILTLEGAAMENIALLQLQITGDYILK